VIRKDGPVPLPRARSDNYLVRCERPARQEFGEGLLGGIAFEALIWAVENSRTRFAAFGVGVNKDGEGDAMAEET
jgi:hypothetical protein